MPFFGVQPMHAGASREGSGCLDEGSLQVHGVGSDGLSDDSKRDWQGSSNAMWRLCSGQIHNPSFPCWQKGGEMKGMQSIRDVVVELQ
jgi:hypothetical protein